MIKAALEESDILDETNDVQVMEQPQASFIYIELPGEDTGVAAIYVRPGEPVAADADAETPLDSNDPPLDQSSDQPPHPTWEALGYWRGEQVFEGSGIANRLYAIEDAATAIRAAAAKSKKKADKAAEQAIAVWIEGMDGMGEDGPAGEPCEWPAVVPPAELTGGEGVSGGEQPVGEETGDEQPTTEQPATDQQPAEQPTADAVRLFEQRIATLSRELVGAVLERVSLENQLKAAKSLEKEIIGEIQSASARGPERFPLFDRSDVAAEENPLPPQAEASGSEPGGAEDQLADKPADQSDGQPTAPPTAWRTAPLSELGLPPKLAERLEEAGISTIGQLEDKRAEFHGLRSIKGIGQVKVDMIETAVIDWLTKNRDRRVFGGVKVSE